MSKARSFSALILGLYLSLQPALASTLVNFDFEELTGQAELIFQGRVSARESGEQQGMLYTWITFEVEEVLKGQLPGQELRLRFLGGDGADSRMQVSDLRLPAEGEQGLYFVESVDRPLVNPLLGWSQGHFLIDENDSGALTVSRADGEQPLLLQQEKQAALRGKLQDMGFGRSALGAKSGGDQYLLDDFKAAIRHEVEGRQ